MPAPRCSVWKQAPRRRAQRTRGRRRTGPALAFDWLESRILFSAVPLAAATPLIFTPADTAQVSHFLADPREANLYRISLNAGDRVSAAVAAATGVAPIIELIREPELLQSARGGKLPRVVKA